MTNLLRYKWFFKSIPFLFGFIFLSSTQAELIAHWPLDGNAQDVTGNGHHGTEVGNITYESSQEGKGQAARFDGKSWISIPVTNDFKFVNQSLTYSLWVTGANEYRQTAAAYLVLIGNELAPQVTLAEYQNYVFMRHSYYPYYLYEARSTDNLSTTNNEWTHLAGVIDYPNRVIKLYINGKLEHIARLNVVNTKNVDTLQIGGHSYQDYNYTHKGLIDDVRIYNTALSDEAIAELAVATPTVMFEYFIATATAEGNQIEFKTLVEIDNAGFNLWRAEKNAADEFTNKVRLNTELIPSQQEALYRFIDDNAKSNQTYYYTIENVDTSGISKWHEDLIAVVKPDSLLIPASCLIYGIHDKGLNNSMAFTINPETQEIMQLGNLHKGRDIEAMAIHPDTKIIYVASGNDTKGYPKGHFYKMDAQTGELISVGHTGFEEISDLVFNADGTVLWAWAKKQGIITINPTTGEGTLEIPADALVEGFTLVEGNFYGSANTILWKYDVNAATLEIACSDLPGETESLTTIGNDLLLLGLHGNSELKVFDSSTCQVINFISSGQFDDVEAIAWPSCQ